ncbi:hypothetical protein D3Y55_22050 [Mesorhizobium sp. DCY119]|nr:hypothetical protein D3Y55_22050 [Mesorhizobium sp. DCY119]
MCGFFHIVDVDLRLALRSLAAVLLQKIHNHEKIDVYANVNYCYGDLESGLDAWITRVGSRIVLWRRI